MIFPQKKYEYDLIVIGSGDAGSVAAHYAVSLNKKVAICEQNNIGGNSLSYTSLLTRQKQASSPQQPLTQWKKEAAHEATIQHNTNTLKDAGVTIIPHKVHFISPHEIIAGEEKYAAAKFLIATGSNPYIPQISGLQEAGYRTYRNILDMQNLPKTLLLYGSGETSCELAQLFAHTGTNVTIVTRSSALLPKEDPDVSTFLYNQFLAQRINIITQAQITKVAKKENGKAVYIKHEGKEFVGEFDEIIIACGNTPNLDFHPQNAGLTITNKKLFVKKTLQTNTRHIYAAGDVINQAQLSNTSTLQGYVAAKNMFHAEKIIPDLSVTPRCIFTYPQIARVGVMEQEVQKNKKTPYKKGTMQLSMLQKAQTMNETEGYIKIITDKKGIIQGGTIVSPSANEMIHEIALAIKCRVSAEELADMIHVSPSYSEGIKIACSMVK